MLSVVMPQIDRGFGQDTIPWLRTAAVSSAADLIMTSTIARLIRPKLPNLHNFP